tara:strand:+ start:287 stop:538 length:252 start_codon:yes stop_codon:yes gene_type:complete
MRKYQIEFLISTEVEVEEDTLKDDLMGQLYQALDLNKYKFNGFDITNFKGESHVVGLTEDEENAISEKPLSLAEMDEDELDQV